MKVTTRKVYQCEHCNKNMLSAGSMSRHEKYCRANPNNKHKCFDFCRFLERERHFIEKDIPGCGFKTVFTCGLTEQKMYSYLGEKKATSYFGNPMKIDGLIRMPLQCGDYKVMTIEEERRFNNGADEETH